MDHLNDEQQKLIASLLKEIENVRSNTLTDFKSSFSSMKDIITSKNEMTDKQRKETSYLEMEGIQLMEDHDARILKYDVLMEEYEVRILECFYPGLLIYSTLWITYSSFYSSMLQKSKPRVVGKVWDNNHHDKGGWETWPTWTILMFLAMLSLHVPPTTIGKSIAIVANSIHPDERAIGSSPCTSITRKCCSVLSVTTETLAAHQLACAPLWLQHHSDGTNLRQLELENLIV
jgi:hypothetical protein